MSRETTEHIVTRNAKNFLRKSSGSKNKMHLGPPPSLQQHSLSASTISLFIIKIGKIICYLVDNQENMEKSYPKTKTIRHFANRLILSAAKHHKWSTTKVSDLFLLVSEEIDFDSKTAKGYLKSMKRHGSPKLMAELIHRSILQLTERDILDILFEQANDLKDFQLLIKDSVNQSIIDLASTNTILEVST